jgi:hypothetical protein
LRVDHPLRPAKSLKGLCRMTNLCGVSHGQMAKVEVERLSEKGASNAPIVDLAGLRRAKSTGKPLCGDLQGYAASASDAFRTVSEVVFSEVCNREQRPSNSKNHSFEGCDEAHNLAKMPWRENKATRMVEA